MFTKYIIKLFFITSILFLFSCESLDVLKKTDNIKIIYDDEIEFENKINNFLPINKLDYVDFYSSKKMYNWKNNKKLIKLFSFDSFNSKYLDTEPLNIFISGKKIYSLTKKSKLNIYDLNNFKIIKSVPINLINENFSYPSSLAFINDTIYAAYVDGLIVNFDLDGKLIWSRNYNDILKTPIKIHNDNMIVLLSNKVLSINTNSGDIYWEFVYESNNILKALGGNLINKSHLLYFTLPNGRSGGINNIFGEKIDFLFNIKNPNNSLMSSNDSMHSFQNFISFFYDNSLLSTYDLSTNNLILDSNNINNVKSHFFINNILITFHNDNLLKVYNITNKKLFWQNDLTKSINKNNLIINSIIKNNTIIIFFESGEIIEFNLLDGKILNILDLKLSNINSVYFINEFIIISQKNGKTTLFTQ